MAHPTTLLHTHQLTTTPDIFQGSFPLVFGPEGHGFNTGEQGLSFTGLFVGSLVGAACSPLQDWYYCRAIKAKGAGSPEARMWMARWAIFCFPVSLFWFAWTSYTSGRCSSVRVVVCEGGRECVDTDVTKYRG